jgi:hypothetical protein
MNICIYVYMYTCIYVYMRICMYVYVCMYICICIYTFEITFIYPVKRYICIYFLIEKISVFFFFFNNILFISKGDSST